MGYFPTISPDEPPVPPVAIPKTHTPGPQVQERGLRCYSPSLGRWVNRDPIGKHGGPNVFVYILNRPYEPD